MSYIASDQDSDDTFDGFDLKAIRAAVDQLSKPTVDDIVAAIRTAINQPSIEPKIVIDSLPEEVASGRLTLNIEPPDAPPRSKPVLMKVCNDHDDGYITEK